jgi:hypothetical protein
MCSFINRAVGQTPIIFLWGVEGGFFVVIHFAKDDGHAWPPLNPYIHPPLHLAPIMLTPLTKIIKSKANSFHPFSKFFLFHFMLIFLDFILCNDEINMLWKRSK